MQVRRNDEKIDEFKDMGRLNPIWASVPTRMRIWYERLTHRASCHRPTRPRTRRRRCSSTATRAVGCGGWMGCSEGR
eukprot:4379653-Pleurochrysis_carterae.AAC.1